MKWLRSSISLLVFCSLAFSGSNVIRAQTFHQMIQDIQPRWSPDGSMIAFSSNRSGNFEIYVWDRYLLKLHRVSHHPAGDYYPEWAPDENAIAFYSERSDDNHFPKQIYVLSGGTLTAQFPKNSSKNGDLPSWSSRNHQIIFHRVDYTGHYQIYVIKPFQKKKRQITVTPWDHLFPRWSPDASKIMYISNQLGSYDIYLMDNKGNHSIPLTHDKSFELDAVWSPDGKKISFVSNRNENFDIYVMNADGSNVKRLTVDPEYDLCPDWSPDGSRLLFVSNRAGNFDIYSMNTDGSDVKRLTTDPGEDSYASWSPDGHEILFVSDRNGSPRIYIMKSDGTRQHELEMEGEGN